MNRRNPLRYILLFLPYLLSLVFDFMPSVGFLIAWSGSFYIFYLTLTGKIEPIPTDLKVSEQLMRPLFLTQIIFAGYMASTSIFYFMEVLGYTNFSIPPEAFQVDENRLRYTVQAQQYYCLGHASLAAGLLLMMRFPVKTPYSSRHLNYPAFFLKAALVSLPLSMILMQVPGFSQFAVQASATSFIAGTLALAFAIPLRKRINTLICAILFGFNFYQALISGYKEPILVSVMVLGVFLYPFYKRTVFYIFSPVILLLILLLPVYNRIYREQAWNKNVEASEATRIAIEGVVEGEFNDESNWGFLTNRFSEIGFFTRYIETTPSQIDYYGFTLLQQAVEVVIPRFFWPDKPITEKLVMERVYDAGVVNRLSTVSAKPQLIVDAYLSAGGIGVFLILFLYGVLVQGVCRFCEKLYGGYLIGTALVFTGLFQIFWRGLSLEFLINSTIWSLFTTILLFWMLRLMHVIRKVNP